MIICVKLKDSTYRPCSKSFCKTDHRNLDLTPGRICLVDVDEGGFLKFLDEDIPKECRSYGFSEDYVEILKSSIIIDFFLEHYREIRIV